MTQYPSTVEVGQKWKGKSLGGTAEVKLVTNGYVAYLSNEMLFSNSIEVFLANYTPVPPPVFDGVVELVELKNWNGKELYVVVGSPLVASYYPTGRTVRVQQVD